MILYNSIFIFISLVILLRKKQKKFYIFLTLIFFVLSFIRWEMGTDWRTYFQTFFTKNVNEMIYVSEIGYRYLNNIIYRLFPSYTFMLFTIALIIFPLKYSFMYRYSSFPLLSLLMNFCLNRGDIFFVRHNIAIAILLFSTKYIIEKKKTKFIISVGIATLFHWSSLIFICSYFLYNYLKLKRCQIIFWVICGILLSKYNLTLFENIVNLIPASIYKEKLLFYLNNRLTYIYKAYLNANLVYIIALSNRLFLITLFIILYKKIEELYKKIFNLYFFGCLLYIFFYSISPEIARLANLFDDYALVLFPSLYKYMNKKYKKIIFLCITLMYLYLKLLSGLTSYSTGTYFPYKSIFDL